MAYDFIPLLARKPLRRLDGSRFALAVTTNLEYWGLIKESSRTYRACGPAALPDAPPENILIYHISNWLEHDHRNADWWMFDSFDGAGVPAGATINCQARFEQYPDVGQAVIEGAWEVVSQNFEQGDLLTNYNFDTPAYRMLNEETLALYERVVGKLARGWISSFLRSGSQTVVILASCGLIFLCDYMNGDQRYLIRTPSVLILSVPYSIETNDFTFFHRNGMSPDMLLDLLPEQSDRRYLECVWWATRENVELWYVENRQNYIPTG